MHTILVENKTKIKKAIPVIESKIKINIFYKDGKVIIKGNELNEFICCNIIRAIDFGFDAEDALLLKDENYVLEFINIKDYTKKRNLQEIRRRIIGTNGKAKRTIEELTGCIMVINGNKIGLIVSSEHLDSAVQAVISLIQGSKHANVFAYLEKQNRILKKIDKEDLGLKDLG